MIPRVPHERFDGGSGCPVEATLSLIDGKWKGVTLFHLLRSSLWVVYSCPPRSAPWRR